MTDDGIRAATPADASAVRAVTEAAYHPYVERIGVRPAPMDADVGADIAAGRVFVTGDPVVGVLVLVPHGDHLLLESVAVRPDAHGRGIGGRLLDFAESFAREHGLPEVRLCTHVLMTENQRIYGRRGYEETARGRPDRHHRIHYSKRV
ncbi:GNAT family N-acetyltransferase [Streptomyces sp. NPDC048639]|uniref:GNAT family N-acetyltransferase n=1 Tax=Streptomyces sp. NPDC048639 TaxID=3365581 RepID=UPI003722BCBA